MQYLKTGFFSYIIIHPGFLFVKPKKSTWHCMEINVALKSASIINEYI